MNDFDFIDEYTSEIAPENLLPENEAATAINCAFVGFGSGGGKLARAFLDLGFNKTLLFNTTEKDFQHDIDDKHLVVLPGSDGVAKNIELGKKVLSEASAFVEDALRTRLGKVDWLFVSAGGGGGTGSSVHVLDPVFDRYLKACEATGRIVYIVSTPTAQEKLNVTVRENSDILLDSVKNDPHVVLDNERQLNSFRGKVGVLGLYPAANKAFAKMFWQLLKLATEQSPVQTFDGKDLERFLSSDGRIIVGSAIVQSGPSAGVELFQKCIDNSPCPKPSGKSKTGVLLLVLTEADANDADVSGHLEAATSYVGGRTDTLFSGIYVRDPLPGVVSVLALGGLE
jgi:cell division GTPase FtsZ